MSKKYVKNYQFEVDVIIKWIDISIKTQSHLKFNVNSGLHTLNSEKQIVYNPKQKGKLNIDETFKFYVNIDFDSRKDRFVTKPICVDLLVLTPKQNKVAGKSEINLSQILNEERVEITETKKIMRCLDKNAKLTYSVKLNYKGETPENVLEEAIIEKEFLDNDFLNLTLDTFDFAGVPKFIKEGKRSLGRSRSPNRSIERSKSPSQVYGKGPGYFDYKRLSRDPHTNESSEINWTKSYDSDRNQANVNPNILLNQEPDKSCHYKPIYKENNYLNSEERLYTEIPSPIRQGVNSPNKTYDFEICPNPKVNPQDELKYKTDIKSKTPKNEIIGNCYSLKDARKESEFEQYKEAFENKVNQHKNLDIKLDHLKKENTLLQTENTELRIKNEEQAIKIIELEQKESTQENLITELKQNIEDLKESYEKIKKQTYNNLQNKVQTDDQLQKKYESLSEQVDQEIPEIDWIAKSTPDLNKSSKSNLITNTYESIECETDNVKEILETNKVFKKTLSPASIHIISEVDLQYQTPESKNNCYLSTIKENEVTPNTKGSKGELKSEVKLLQEEQSITNLKLIDNQKQKEVLMVENERQRLKIKQLEEELENPNGFVIEDEYKLKKNREIQIVEKPNENVHDKELAECKNIIDELKKELENYESKNKANIIDELKKELENYERKNKALEKRFIEEQAEKKKTLYDLDLKVLLKKKDDKRYNELVEAKRKLEEDLLAAKTDLSWATNLIMKQKDPKLLDKFTSNVSFKESNLDF